MFCHWNESVSGTQETGAVREPLFCKDKFKLMKEQTVVIWATVGDQRNSKNAWKPSKKTQTNKTITPKKPTENPPKKESICLEAVLCLRLSLCAGCVFLFVSPSVSISHWLTTVLLFAILVLSRYALSWESKMGKVSLGWRQKDFRTCCEGTCQCCNTSNILTSSRWEG